MKYLFLVASAITLVACSNAETDAVIDNAADIAHDVAQAKKGIEISSAYVLPPFPGRDVAAGFFEITNHGADDRLVAVSSPISDNVEIHTHIEEDGIMKMRKIEGVSLSKGETIVFRPGSFHIMMFGADIPENAEDVALTFSYENAEPVTLIVPIGDPDDKMEDGNSSQRSGTEY